MTPYNSEKLARFEALVQATEALEALSLRAEAVLVVRDLRRVLAQEDGADVIAQLGGLRRWPTVDPRHVRSDDLLDLSNTILERDEKNLSISLEDECVMLVAMVQSILFPGGNADAEHNAGTLEDMSRHVSIWNPWLVQGDDE